MPGVRTSGCKIGLLLVALLLAISTAYASEWAIAYGGSDDDYAYSIQQTSDGGYIVAGYTSSFGAGYDAWILKLDANGNIPDCNIITDTNADVTTTSATPLNTNAAWYLILNDPTTTSATVTVTSAQPQQVCYYSVNPDPLGENMEPDSYTNAYRLYPTDYIYNAYIYGDDEDWYVFTLTSSARINITTYPPSPSDDADTKVYLYDSNLNLIDSNDDGGYNYYSQLVIDLNPGTYYIKVTRYEFYSDQSTGSGYYNLAVVKGAKTEIPIGVLVDLSGPLWKFGNDIRNTLSIAEVDINRYFENEELPYYVKFYFEDTRVDPSITLQKIQDLYANGINLIIGPMGSGEIVNIKSFVASNKIIVVSPSSTALPTLLGITTPAEKKYIFRFIGTDDLQTDAIVGELKSLGIKSVVIIYIDNGWGRSLCDVLEPKLDSVGIEIERYVEYPDPPPADFSHYIAEMENAVGNLLKNYSPPEIAIVAFGWEEVATILSQINSDSPLLSVIWIGSDGVTLSDKALDACSKTSQVGLYSTLFESKGVALSDLESKYEENGFGKTPYQYSLNAYDAAWVLALSYVEVIDAVGNYDPESMAEIMPTVTEWYSEGKYDVRPVSGYITLNEWNDRASGNYTIWYVNKSCEWDVAGVWSSKTQTVEWYHKPQATSNEITNCTVIDSPGYYYLANDIIDSDAEVCIHIKSSDVILDGRGHVIDGIEVIDGIGGSTGISVSNFVNIYDYEVLTNVTIKNITITEWYWGVMFIVFDITNLTKIQELSYPLFCKAHSLS